MSPPVLQTDRLDMRLHEMGDFPSFRAFWMSERAQHIGGPLGHEFEVWRQFTSERGHWALRGFGLWTLVGRATGAVLGWVGLQQPAHYDAPELAWHMTQAGEGQGLAYEAARAALAHGRASLGLTRVISYVSDANAKSLALAERLGALVAERGSFQGRDYTLFEHPMGAA
jgi:RimJ/RimL family protein N-acetyltransferase